MSKPHHETLANLLGEALTPQAPPAFASGPLEVNIIFTDLRGTAASLNFAQSFARELGARIRVRAAIAVPLRLPFDEPPVSLAFLEENLRNLLSQLEKDAFDPSVHLYLCRDRLATLLQVLRPNSLVVIGGPKRWWPTAETRMACALRSHGHRVIFVDSRTRSGFQRPTFAR
jgi:hypothetical protein